MQSSHRTRRAVVAATVVSLAYCPAPATSGDLSLRTGGGVPIGALPSSSNLTGTGLGIGTDGEAGLNLNTPNDDRSSSTSFESNRLTVPDALNRLSIHSDSAGKPSVIYKFVNTKF